ncbi:MAG: hypothetical protein U1F27_11720 [Turneriella sp.]
MRLRNFLPLIVYVLLLSPLALLFLFAWQGHTWPILLMQLVHTVFLFAVYRASVRSARKNSSPPVDLSRVVYLPLKVNLVVYFLIGIPLVSVFADNLAVLMVAYGVQTLGFIFTCYSGILYVSRSTVEK